MLSSGHLLSVNSAQRDPRRAAHERGTPSCKKMLEGLRTIIWTHAKTSGRLTPAAGRSPLESGRRHDIFPQGVADDSAEADGCQTNEGGPEAGMRSSWGSHGLRYQLFDWHWGAFHLSRTFRGRQVPRANRAG